MDISTINVLTELGTNLTSLAVKGTTTAIHTKIKSAQNEKNIVDKIIYPCYNID